MKIDGGATIWARKTIESDIFCWKPHVWFKIWFYIVNKANHKDTKQFEQGQCFLCYQWIMTATKATKDQVKHCIGYLKGTHMIATRKATRGLIVEVLKYETYQDLNNYKSHTKSLVDAIQKPHESHTRDKNGNNDKNVKKDLVFIFDFWRETCNHPAAKLTPARRDKIRMRLKEFSIDDLQFAIKNCSESDYHVENGYTWLVKNILKSREKVEWWLERGRKKSASERRLEELKKGGKDEGD